MNKNLEFKRYVRYVLTTLNLTVEQLAEAIDASPRSVFRWASGVNRPSAEYLLKMFMLQKPKECQ